MVTVKAILPQLIEDLQVNHEDYVKKVQKQKLKTPFKQESTIDKVRLFGGKI